MKEVYNILYFLESDDGKLLHQKYTAMIPVDPKIPAGTRFDNVAKSVMNMVELRGDRSPQSVAVDYIGITDQEPTVKSIGN